MQLPRRVQNAGHGWLYLSTFVVLDAILTLTIFLGPGLSIWFGLSPHTFWERLATAVVCGILTVIFGIGAFFFSVWFISKWTNW